MPTQEFVARGRGLKRPAPAVVDVEALLDSKRAPKRQKVTPTSFRDDDDRVDEYLIQKFDWFSFSDVDAAANPWMEAAESLAVHHADAKADFNERSAIRPLYEISVERLRKNRKTDGALKWAEFDTKINSLGFVWTAEQQMLIRAVKEALLRSFYGPAGWEKERLNIMKEMSLTERELLGKPTICNMPRQFGKSSVLRAICAVIMVVLAGIGVVVFGPGRRTAHIFTEGVVGMIHRIPGALNRIVCCNTEELKVAASELDSDQTVNSNQAKMRRNDPTTSTLWSLPANEKGACVFVCRGGGGGGGDQ